MDAFITEDLNEIIVRCKTANPNRYKLRPQTYLKQFSNWFKNNKLTDEEIKEGIVAFNRENEHANKLSIEYLKGIFKNQLKDRIIQKKREERCLGGLPNEIR